MNSQLTNNASVGLVPTQQTQRKNPTIPVDATTAPQKPFSLPFALLIVAVVAQTAAITITWPLWNVRSSGLPHLPVFPSLPQISFGWLLLLTLAWIPLLRRTGVWIHFIVLLVATLFDQMRAQPQFLATWILMVAATYQTGAALTRWFLASLWIWAGAHKLISPDWMSHRSANMTHALRLDVESFSYIVAMTVALSEILVGLLAWLKPRWAAFGCVALHVGIVIYLSPLFRAWNYSVFPWNLATAVIGFWVLWNAESREWFGQAPSKTSRHRLFERLAFTVMMIVPAGFYVGWLDHGYAHVLYSDSIPRGLISKQDGSLSEIRAWGELAIPFPNERRLLKQHFGIVGQSGAKLHIRDPRPWLDDLYFQMTSDGPVEISRAEFFANDKDSIAGVELDSIRAKFILSRIGTTFRKRDSASMIWTVQFSPDKFDAEYLKYLDGISNVEEIQLADTSLTDADLSSLPALPKLVGLGLSRTNVTDHGIKQLMLDRNRKFPRLEFILADGTNVSDELQERFNGGQ